MSRLGEGYPPSVQLSICPSTPADATFSQCAASRSITGRYGTADSSHVQFNCRLPAVFSPAAFASAQCFVARGPGPTTEREYSPTSVFTPPRVIGSDHSLTDISQQDLGSAAIASAAHSSFQPQSQAITFASMLAPPT